jgi:hypothetical protein
MVQLHLMVGVRGVVIASSVHERDYERERDFEREGETMREREREIIVLCSKFFWLWERVDGAKDDGYQTR